MHIAIREMRSTSEDFTAVVEIDNAVDPAHGYTFDQFRYDYESFDTQKYILRYYLAERAGRVLGYACDHHMPYRFHPQRFWVWVAVHPAFHGQGIGRLCTTEFSAIFRSFRPAGSIPPRAKPGFTAKSSWKNADSVRFGEAGKPTLMCPNSMFPRFGNI